MGSLRHLLKAERKAIRQLAKVSVEKPPPTTREALGCLPDLTFEIISNAEAGPGAVVAPVVNAWHEYWVAAGASAYRPLSRGSGS